MCQGGDSYDPEGRVHSNPKEKGRQRHLNKESKEKGSPSSEKTGTENKNADR